MLITKIIYGKIVNYDFCKENYIKYDYTENIYECDYMLGSYDWKYRDRTCYSVTYHNMRVQYFINGEKQEMVFKEAYMERFLDKNDVVRLTYNRISKKVLLVN